MCIWSSLLVEIFRARWKFGRMCSPDKHWQVLEPFSPSAKWGARQMTNESNDQRSIGHLTTPKRKWPNDQLPVGQLTTLKTNWSNDQLPVGQLTTRKTFLECDTKVYTVAFRNLGILSSSPRILAPAYPFSAYERLFEY